MTVRAVLLVLLSAVLHAPSLGQATTKGKAPAPPPPRQMTVPNASAAIALLKTAPKGSRVVIQTAGGDSEVNSFTSQVVRLFNDTNGTWVIGDISLSRATAATNGDDADSGSGFHCSAANRASGAGEIAIKALAMTGYPCVRDPDGHNPPASEPSGQNPPPVDLYLSIGARTVPPS